MKSEFNIFYNKYQELTDISINWFIKSLNYIPETEEWQICRLKEKILMKEAMKNLENAVKELK